ncbi:MAG: uracil-DNA glycosylase [Gemmatimonadota bacterium]
MSANDVLELQERVVECRACPRLVAWREKVAEEKRAAFADEDYWGAPVPGFGDPEAGLLVVGLAPAAHGANRTGRMFTGDRSGDWLYAAMHRAGFASQPESTHRGDGLELTDAWVTAPVRCAPPQNRPKPAERDNCADWLSREFEALERVRVAVVLGGYGWTAFLRVLRSRDWDLPVPQPKFGHMARAELEGEGRRLSLVGSYHPSQQNTFTGTLTEEMFDEVWATARELLSA